MTLALRPPSRLLGAVAHGAGALAWDDLPVCGAAIGALVGGLLRVRRAHVEAAMERAGVADASAVAAGMYRSLATGLLELLWVMRRPEEARRRAVLGDDTAATLRGAMRGERGFVLAASHTGNWDLAACGLASRVPLLVVTKRLSMGSLDALWQSSRARMGVRLTGAAGALRRGRAMVEAGGAVAMMIDQVPARRRHAVRAVFLGAPAWVDRSPATLAARAGVPLVVGASRRDERGVQRLEVLEVVDPPRAAADAWIREATLRATAALDAFVRAHPTQWLWMHRRWKDPPA